MTAVFLTVPGLLFAQSKAQVTVRDFFKLIPPEYFNIVCCDGDVEEFLEKHATVEDAANGYLAGQDLDNDPKYGGFEMALFKRPDGRHIIGLYSYAMRWYDFYFLEYRNGRLVNISTTIPGYSQKHYYQFPRKGTTIGVYQKKYDDPGAPIGVDNSVTRGRKLYDLVWQNGKFIIKK
jgi:hypothetical protein